VTADNALCTSITLPYVVVDQDAAAAAGSADGC